MIKAKALKPIKTNNEIVGYLLRDMSGTEMRVQSSAIIDAMNKNAITIENLKINSEGKLVMIVDTPKETYSSKAELKVDNLKIGRMHQLVKILNEAGRAYYQDASEIMSNKEYDALYDELVELEAELGTVLNNSPTINIGYEVVSELPKEEHQEVMMSLAKTKDIGEIKSFVAKNDAILGWKLDGLTVVLTYNNGELTKAVTRGNGTIGELVTSNAKHFKNLPSKIRFKGNLVIRGEAIITYTDFNKINEKLIDDEKYKNPRNLASGSVRQLDSKITANRNVHFHAFTLVHADGEDFKTVEETYKFMSELGFEVVESKKVNASNIEAVVNLYSNAVKNKKIDLPVDGLVLTYNDLAYAKSLGATAKTPRHSIAFKWADEVVETKLLGIEWSASKTGLLNPVAIFEPVDIEGSTVSRASVHNVSIFLGLELGFGDRIGVYKANMIIPQISENFTRSDTCEIPDYCPVCDGETEIRKDPSSGVYTLYCTNPDCPAKGNRLLKHFVSRDAMNIDGISGSTLEKLADYGIVDTFASVFRIGQHPEIMDIEGFGETSFNNMVNAINRARNVKLHNLIYALSIPNIGLQTAKIICNNFDNSLEKTVTASYMDLASIDGIGDVIASNFFNYFRNKENVDNFVDLVKELHVIQEEVKKADTSDKMFGKTFCVTGKVYVFPNRDAVKALIESRGGKLTGSVSRSTDFLITNDTGSGSRKNKAAAEYGIPILTEEEFIKEFEIEV